MTTCAICGNNRRVTGQFSIRVWSDPDTGGIRELKTAICYKCAETLGLAIASLNTRHLRDENKQAQLIRDTAKATYNKATDLALTHTPECTCYAHHVGMQTHTEWCAVTYHREFVEKTVGV